MNLHLGEIYANSSGRSKEAVRNIMLSFFAKGISVASSLLIVPLTIHYVNPTRYGIWLTLSSVIGWILFFDLGLGNGFRNKFAEARARGDMELARQYVSTTYFAVSGIVLFLFLVILLVNSFVDWASILNVDAFYKNELSRIFVILALFSCMNMVASLVCTLLTADQKAGFASLIQGFGQLLSLVVIWILTKVSDGSLTNLALFFAGVPCLFTLFVSVVAYSFGKYRQMAPNINYVNFSLIRDILGLGIQFFVIYLCMIIVFQMINIAISREIGPDAVTQYNVAYKYFAVTHMIINVIVFPLWSAFTDAYQKNDFVWMKQIIRKLEVLWLLSNIVLVVMLIISNWVYEIWIGDEVEIGFILSVVITIYMIINNLGAIYLNLINGIGTVRIQLIIYIVFAVVAWPLMIKFGREYGIVGVIMVPITALFFLAVFAKVQLMRIMNHKAKGIWAR